MRGPPIWNKGFNSPGRSEGLKPFANMAVTKPKLRSSDVQNRIQIAAADRIGEVGMIENIEGFHARFHAGVLRETDLAMQREIDLPRGGAAQCIAAQSVGPSGVLESIRVKAFSTGILRPIKEVRLACGVLNMVKAWLVSEPRNHVQGKRSVEEDVVDPPVS
jgi:hypothetical protein